MSKNSGAQVDHMLRKYPELLNTFDVIDNNGLNSKKDVGLRRILRKHMERCKKSHTSKKQPKFRPKRFENRVLDVDIQESSNQKNEKLFTCPICRSVLETPVTVVCGHTFCKDCLNQINDGKCSECATNIECLKSTNILVQDIVDKWRNVQKTEGGVPKSRDRLAPEPRYCLRSRCNGLHGNSLDDANTKSQKEFTPGRQKQDIFRGTLLEKTWNDITVSDLECILCSQCLLAPVTTTCGHTFCRECLARVLDHGLACPLCMAPLKTTEQYRGETLVLTQALRLLASAEHQERVTISQQEIETLEKSSEIPMFICTNTFPKVACPLFVYEPRYRLLSRRCLQSTRKRFGMAAKTADGDKFALYGTLLEITDCVNLQDGTSILTTIGLRRFKVLSRGEQDGYDTAVVQYIRDSTVSMENLPGLIALHQTVHSKTLRWLETFEKSLLTEIERCIGYMPELEKDWSSLPDGPAWTWWLLAILPLSMELRAGFVASTNLEKRLMAIEKMLDHLKIRRKALERRTLNCNNTEETAESCSYTERSVDIPYQNTD